MARWCIDLAAPQSGGKPSSCFTSGAVGLAYHPVATHQGRS